MKKRANRLVYIILILLIIVAGIITTTIINSLKNNTSPADIRARAGVINTLKLTGTVSDIDTANVTMTVDNVILNAESRSGQEINYGTWIVTPPRTFTLSSASPGTKVTFVVNSASLDVASRQVVASQVTISR